jgi:hypothetical protein
MKSLRIPLIFLASLLISSFSLSAAQLATAKALSVTGTVTKFSTSGGQSPLVTGDILKAGDSISVTALSNATFVFSNGSTINVKENTSFLIKEFEQDSFSGSQSYEQLEADPSKSQVLLELNYGELDGHVKKLRNGSKFDIETPIGTAAIRGTKFTVRIVYNAERGEFLLVVKNKDGAVNILSRYAGAFEYSEGIGDKGYQSALTNDNEEAIPQTYTAIIRLNRRDPKSYSIFNMIQSFIPTADRPDPADDDEIIIKIITPEDPDIDIVSPSTAII